MKLLEADNGEVFDEALLDLLESVVVLVELLTGVGEEPTVPDPVRRRCVREG